ncbi:MAG: Rrf2 family transcriptional regulator [Candidatus Omnitrophota bacterium]
MKITYKGDYSLKAILYLAANYSKDTVTIHEIAEHIDAPVKFLEQVLLDLKRGGFVASKRGKIGGYHLSGPPAEITVGDVIRFVDAPIEPISCVRDGYSKCGDVYKCALRKIWQDVTKATSDIIDNVNFEDLTQQVNSERQALTYSI